MEQMWRKALADLFECQKCGFEALGDTKFYKLSVGNGSFLYLVASYVLLTFYSLAKYT